jgi:ADP-heptose:LPS heptosyltransferase
MTGNRNLFRITRFILLKLPSLFRLLSKFRNPEKRLLIIKADAIGDYILFRNFIQVTKESAKYKDHEVDLLGNRLWRDIAIKYDAAFVSDFSFTTPDGLYYAPLKLLKLAWQLYKRNYDVVLQPTYARTFITDGLAALSAAKNIIGFESDTERISPKYKTKTDSFYSQRLILPANTIFEFERSRFFFETVLAEAIELNGSHININNKAKNGIIIFPGAGVFKRGWEKEKFLALINHIRLNSSQPIYLAGGPSEVQIGNYLTDSLPRNAVNNLINKTSLVQLVELIGNAALVIANETSAIHIAVATKTPSICILGGGHFERFAPYPAGFENAPICLYEKMECYNCNWVCKYTVGENEPYPCITNVSLATVWQTTKPFLTDQNKM